MDKISQLPAHLPTQNFTLQQPAKSVEDNESTSLPTAEQRAATYEMFIQGAANGSTTTKSKLEKSTEKQKTESSSKTANSTQLTSKELQRINIIQKEVLDSVLANPQNTSKLFHLKKDSSKEEITTFVENVKKFGEKLNEQIKAFGSKHPDERLLLTPLLEMVIPPCISAWRTPDPIDYNLGGLEVNYIKGIVLSDLYGQSQDLLAKHNNVNTNYIKMIFQQRMSQHITTLNNLIIPSLSVNELTSLKNILDQNISEDERAEYSKSLTELCKKVLYDIDKLFDVLFDYDKITTLSFILNEIEKLYQSKQEIQTKVHEYIRRIHQLPLNEAKILELGLTKFFLELDLPEKAAEIYEDILELYRTLPTYQDRMTVKSQILAGIEQLKGV